MRAGYGRGYYGSGQLAPTSPRRGRSWIKIVAVGGVGAALVWLLWPRSSLPDLDPPSRSGGGREPDPPVPSPPPIGVQSAPPTGAFLTQLEDDARARGYVSVGDYEDSVVATSKQLQSTGANVVLPPHLQHLAPRLGP